MRAEKENRHVAVYMWINCCVCMFVGLSAIAFGTSACLLCCCPSQIEPDSYVQYPVVEHDRIDKEGSPGARHRTGPPARASASAFTLLPVCCKTLSLLC